VGYQAKTPPTVSRQGLANLLINKDLQSRDGGIRTRDPLNPIQVRYRTALRPVRIPTRG
jgi:hypothetical protein